MIEFDKSICGDLEAACGREWLETNGLGGFASSTISGMNTRRYHGLLVAATKPPVGRVVLLSKLEETLIIDGRRYELSVNQYPSALHPRGDQYLKQFKLDPFPVFTYEVEAFEITKSLFMIRGENSIVIQYELRPSIAGEALCVLEVRPLIAYRDYHSTAHENKNLNPHVHLEPDCATVIPYDGLPALYFNQSAEEIDAAAYWYRNFEYTVEQDRGLDFVEDLFSPFQMRFDLGKRSQAAIIASTERRDVSRVSEYRQAEIYRRAALVARSPVDDNFAHSLVTAADQYIVARGDKKTIIAGYHWFSDWGRDTMIALPGLTLATCPYDVAQSILLEFARHVDRGMLPNRFPDAGEPAEYNTVDATLWFFEAIRSLAERTGDYEFIRSNLYDVLVDIIGWHERGTRYGIRVEADGLLASGEEGVQLTWMDAKVGDWVVTPRRGKAVEIQALWYNALRVMEQLAREFGDEVGRKRYSDMAARARRSFNDHFWNSEAGCLYDCINGDVRDSSVRPNQILAVSLHHSMLARAQAKRVVDAVERHLLTPYGLRSLAPSDPQYTGRYGGDPRSRDGAYHQGTVWAWLMGPFVTAYVKVNNRTAKSRKRAFQLLEAFSNHLTEAGLGQVSEIFDGDAPHVARGCIAQAWSVSELLRALVEDVYDLRPVARKAMAVKSSVMA
jgi:predicted glycogen debranching enzyme